MREHTAAVRACVAAKEAWLDTVREVPSICGLYYDESTPIRGAELADAKVALRAHDTFDTVADVDHDFPEGLIDGDDASESGPGAVAAPHDVTPPPDDGAPKDGGDDGDTLYDGLVVRLGADGDDLEDACEESAAANEAAADAPVADIPVGAPGNGPRAPSDDHEPPGGVATVLTTSGDEIAVHIGHYSGLAVMRSRKAHIAFLASHCETGAPVVPFPSRTCATVVHTRFEAEIGKLAHDPGDRLLREVRNIRDGSMPEAPARYKYLSADVKEVLLRSNMCIVVDCRNKVHEKDKMARLHHTCKDHMYADILCPATGVVYRACGVCKWQRDVERCFPKFKATGDHARTCGKHGTHANCSNAAECKAACVNEPDVGEEEAGLDTSGEYRANRSISGAATALDACMLGHTILTPYVVHAAYSTARKGKHQCLRKGCTNGRVCNDKPICGTLCRSCFQVRLPIATRMPRVPP